MIVRRLSPLLVVSVTTLACRRPDPPQPTSQAEPRPAESTAPKPSPELHIPASQIQRATAAPGERRPLVVVLHGLGGSGQSMFDAFGLAKFGATERVHVLAPDGTLDGTGRRFWDAGTACCNFERRPVDDVARLGTLLQSWSARPDVDPTRIYVVGYSNGGFLAHRLACVHGDLIAGIASLAGAVSEDMPACTPNPRLALLQIHGDADDKVSYRGGNVFNDPHIGRHLSAEQGLAAWGRWLGCSGPSKSGVRLDLDPALPGAETQTLTLQGCSGSRAALWTVRGAGHQVGTASRILAELWAYLNASGRRQAN